MTDWQAVVGRHRQRVWCTAYRMLGNRPDAADCFQETFLAALELSRREPVRNWSALLTHLVVRRALSRLRQRLRHTGRHAELADWATVVSHNPGPVQEAEAAELSARLRQAVAHLPPTQAEAFCLRCLNELSYKDIARRLGVKTSTVGVLLHRARQRLRGLLEPAVIQREPEVMQ